MLADDVINKRINSNEVSIHHSISRNKTFTFSKTRRNFSLVALCSLKFTRCWLLVVKSLVALCESRLLLVAEVARCKNSLVTRCKIRSLLVAEVAHCKNSLVVKNHWLLVAKFSRYLLHKVTKKSQLNLVMDDKI